MLVVAQGGEGPPRIGVDGVVAGDIRLVRPCLDQREIPKPIDPVPDRGQGLGRCGQEAWHIEGSGDIGERTARGHVARPVERIAHRRGPEDQTDRACRADVQ